MNRVSRVSSEYSLLAIANNPIVQKKSYAAHHICVVVSVLCLASGASVIGGHDHPSRKSLTHARTSANQLDAAFPKLRIV